MNNLILTSWKERVKYGDEGPSPQVLIDDGQVRVILGALRAGQAIPAHPEAKAVYHFLEGTGQMFVDEQVIPIAPGVTIYAPSGAKRGMQAETQLAFLAIRVA